MTEREHQHKMTILAPNRPTTFKQKSIKTSLHFESSNKKSENVPVLVPSPSLSLSLPLFVSLQCKRTFSSSLYHTQSLNRWLFSRQSIVLHTCTGLSISTVAISTLTLIATNGVVAQSSPGIITTVETFSSTLVQIWEHKKIQS